MSRYSETRSIGERIALARKRHGMTQIQLAGRVPTSLSMLRKVEQGSRDATPGLVAAVARALDVSVTALNGQPYDQDGGRRDRIHALMPALRRALTYWDLAPEFVGEPRSFQELLTDTEFVARLRREARHISLLQRLPDLLIETTAAVHAASEVARERLHGLLVVQLFAAHSAAHKTGYEDLAAVVEDRISWAAQGSGDPMMGAVAAWARTTSMLTVGSYDIGLRLLDRVQNDIDPQGPGACDEALKMLGPLCLRSAMLAARSGDPDSAGRHLARASHMVGHIGGADGNGGYHQLAFGPTNVAIHQVAVAVELGDGAQAVARARELSGTPMPGVPQIRLAHHFMDLSRAQLWMRDRQGALESLNAARKFAPEQTRHHPTTHEVVRMLVRTHVRSNQSLADFASWVGDEL
jgi:transcriptional regulator with XRE-family HTH domain